LFNPGDVVAIDFPGVTGVKRRPTVIVSSPVYHAARPDVVVGLITSQTTAIGPTDTYCRIGHRRACESHQSFGVFSLRYPPLLIPCLPNAVQSLSRQHDVPVFLLTHKGGSFYSPLI
jgi:mRNA interferase MazF